MANKKAADQAQEREMSRLDRRLKVVEDAIRRDLSIVPGGHVRAAAFDAELARADVVILPGDRVFHLDEQQYGTVLEWHARRNEGIVKWEDGEQAKANGYVVRKVEPTKIEAQPATV